MLEVLRTAVRSLMGNKARSLLTMLGVVIGVGAVITMVALGQGAGARIESSVASVGRDILIVFPGAPNTSGVRGSAGSGSALTRDDGEAIALECPSVAAVAIETFGRAQVVFENMNWSAPITGTTPPIFDIREWRLAEGRFFGDGDVKNGAKVCLLGITVAENLFGHGEVVGKTVRIQKTPFEVVGVLASKGQTPWGQDQDDVVLMPLTTAQRHLFRSAIPGAVRRLTIKGRDAASVLTAQDEITALLRQRHRIPHDGDDDFVVRNMTDILEASAESTRIMSLLLGAVASVSLLVGGIGIMNIMLVSVTERTKEIGIRMAVGARPGDIRWQFLTEALVLSLLGGGVGILLGAGASRGITAWLDWPTQISPSVALISFGFSGLVGVFFGFYPAWKASLLDPIEALRHE